MKNDKEIEQDDGQELCDDCGVEYNKAEIVTCSICHKQLCDFCVELHECKDNA